MEISYITTRGGRERLRSAQAILKGIGEDGGLFVPDRIPPLPVSIEEMRGFSYQRVAKTIIEAYFTDLSGDIPSCVDRAYDEKFGSQDVVPLVKVNGTCFLELYHGRTAAFKDLALSILPYLMTLSAHREKEKRKLCILTATSGDTGKAAIEGFSDVEGTEILVFYPEEGVSPMQKAQMLEKRGKNTHVFGIRGNFDQAQQGVKQIFASERSRQKLGGDFLLSSANSINIGRLVPQIAYYVYGYIRLMTDGVIRPHQPINICVPTGNFGNILAAWYASRMGIPVHTFLCASNRNKVLADFFHSGLYDTDRDFYVTESPSMDILVSSNLERLLYHLAGPERTSALMADLRENGRYAVGDDLRSRLSSFYGGFADAAETKEAIREMYEDHHYLIDTHTAVAYQVYKKYRKETGDQRPTLVAATASAFKFPRFVAEAIGLPISPTEDDYVCAERLEERTGIAIPPVLKDIRKRPRREALVIDREEMEETVIKVLEQTR